MTIAAWTLSITTFARKTFLELPFKVKASMLVYLLYAPFLVGLMTWVMSNIRDWQLVIYFAQWRSLVAFSEIVWTCLHWQFTAYYL